MVCWPRRLNPGVKGSKKTEDYQLIFFPEKAMKTFIKLLSLKWKPKLLWMQHDEFGWPSKWRNPHLSAALYVSISSKYFN